MKQVKFILIGLGITTIFLGIIFSFDLTEVLLDKDIIEVDYVDKLVYRIAIKGPSYLYVKLKNRGDSYYLPSRKEEELYKRLKEGTKLILVFNEVEGASYKKLVELRYETGEPIFTREETINGLKKRDKLKENHLYFIFAGILFLLAGSTVHYFMWNRIFGWRREI